MTAFNLGCISLPVFIATGVHTVNGDAVFEFSGGEPPVDGSVCLAVLQLDPSFGTLRGGAEQHLMFFTGQDIGGIVPYAAPSPNVSAHLSTGWQPLST